jgi:hypothetical protein
MKNNYNLLERHFANLLKNNPGIKAIIKQSYQFAMWLLHKQPCKKNTEYKLIAYTDGDKKESFFGYYDKSPISPDGRYILYHSSAVNTKNKPDLVVPVEIIAQDISSNAIVLHIPSTAYNWQQGCRAQWLNNDLFVFNDFDENRRKYIARVWSVASLKEEKVFDYPVQDAYHTQYFLSLNYRRLMTLRPDYGYRNLPILSETELTEKTNDGIWKIDYDSGKIVLLVSLSALCDIGSNRRMTTAIHKVNHIMISPSSRQFIFIHRYYIGKSRFHRLMHADSVTGALSLLAEGIVSHCCWINEQTILAYLSGQNRKAAYWMIDLATRGFTCVAGGRLDPYGDGHPHIHGDWFVTDTYPDKARMQHLMLMNWKTGEIRELGRFFHDFSHTSETRCDLHPRFSPDGSSVFFDSVFSGKRQLYKMELFS